MFERAITWIAHQSQNLVPYRADNPFLEGAFAPVLTETTETRLRVIGRIPRELNGIYARIGPNPIAVANPAIHHWFLGDGMVHGVRLRDGEAVWYRNRWIGSDTVNARLGRPPAPGPRHHDISTVNTNVIGHAGGIWALTEGAPLPVELDSGLETLRHGLFESDLRRSFAAHPHRDPSTGELHAICYDVLTLDSVSYVVVGTDGQIKRDVPVPVRHGPMIHDCAITNSRVVDPGPADHLFDARPSARGDVPVPVEPQAPGPHRPAAAHWHGRRCHLVRGRAVLRVPRRERVRPGGRQRSPRYGHLSAHVRWCDQRPRDPAVIAGALGARTRRG